MKIDLIWTISMATLVFVIQCFFIIAFTATYLKRKTKHIHEMASLKHTYQQELLKTQLEIQEETIKYISEEIHDNIGQVLSLAKLHLNVLPPPVSATDQNIIIETKNLVSKAINDLRNLSKSLHPDLITQLGLEENLKRELDILEKTGLYKTTYQVEGKQFRLPAEKQVIIFRIFQEGLNNIIKHALASKVELHLLYETAQFTLMLTDNGKGIDKPEINNALKGIGLTSMNHRALMIGGTLQIINGTKAGTILKVTVPINVAVD